MMRGQTAKVLVFVVLLSFLAADMSVGCGRAAYVFGQVEQKFSPTSQETDRLVMISGQTYLVPPLFFSQIDVGDTVKFNGSKWSIVKKADGTVPAQSSP